MPPRTDLILYLDTEETGSGNDFGTDEDLIEIGVIALRRPDLVEVASFTSLVQPRPETLDGMADVVVAMHEKSGLLDDLIWKDLPTPEHVDDALVKWVETLVGKDTTHIPFGGDGVLHFDRKYIKRQLPRFDKRITHWAFDVGPIRRTFEMAEAEWYKAPAEKTHRALDDARGHADELRFAVNFIRGAAGFPDELERVADRLRESPSRPPYYANGIVMASMRLRRVLAGAVFNDDGTNWA